MESTKSITVEVPNLANVTRRRSLPIGFFCAAMLFFLFNFCEMSCQGQRIAAVTGIQLATGATVEQPKMDDPFGFGGGDRQEKEDGKKMPANPWAILAFLAAVVGAGVGVARLKNADLVGAIAGGAGMISLILLQTTLSASIREEGHGMIQLNFLFPYWAALLSHAGAAILCLLRWMPTSAAAGPTLPTAGWTTQPAVAPPAERAQPFFRLDEPAVENRPLETPVQTVQPEPEPAPQPEPEPVAPPVYRPYQPEAQPVFREQREPAPAAATWNPAPPKSGSGQTLLIGLIAGAVVLVVAAVAVMELKPGLLAGKSAEKGLVEQKKPATETGLTTKQAVATPVSQPSAEASDAALSIGFVHTLTGSDLRLRALPTEHSEVLAGIPNGSPVIILGWAEQSTVVNGQTGKWCRIKFNEQTGWAWGKFIQQSSR